MSCQLGVLARPGRVGEQEGAQVVAREELLLGLLRLGLPGGLGVGVGLLLGVRKAQGARLQLGGQQQVVVPGWGE